MLLDKGDQISLNNVLAGQCFNESGDGLPEAFIRYTDDGRIGHTWMQLQGFLDFFGVNLFATSINALTTSSEKVHCAIDIDAGPVARNRPTHPVDDLKCLGRLFRIFVVANGSVAFQRHAADLAAPWLKFSTIFGEDLGIRTKFKRRSL